MTGITPGFSTGMITAYLGDLHLHPHQNKMKILPSGRNSRLQNGVDAFMQALKPLSRGDRLVFTGDYFEDHKEVPSDALTAAREILDAIKAAGVTAYFLTGNHDQLSRDGLTHSIGLMDQPAHGLHVIDVPCVFAGYAWLPYRRPLDLPAAIAELIALNPKGERMPLVCHVDLIGATANSGHPSTKGIRLGDFPEWADPIISGHYHRGQVIGDRFVYVGSPYQITSGEAGEEKRFMVWRGEGVPGSVADLESIPTTGLPRFRSINVVEWDDMSSDERESVPDDFVTVEVPHGGERPEGLPPEVFVKPLPRPQVQGVAVAGSTADAISSWLVGRNRGDLVAKATAYFEGSSGAAESP